MTCRFAPKISHWTGQFLQVAEQGHHLSHNWTCAELLLQPLLMLQIWSRTTGNCLVYCAYTVTSLCPSQSDSVSLQVAFLGRIWEQLQTGWIDPTMAATHLRSVLRFLIWYSWDTSPAKKKLKLQVIMLRIEKDRQIDEGVVFHQFVKSLGAVRQTLQG